MRLFVCARRSARLSWISAAIAPASLLIAGGLLAATQSVSAGAQTVQTTASIADTSSGTPKPLAMAVNPSTDALVTVNADGSVLYIDGSQAIPVANPAGACTAAALDSLGTTALAAYSSLSEAFFYANGNLDAVTSTVGSCSAGSVPVLSSTAVAGEHSPLVATDSGLGYVYAVVANLSASTADQLLIVNAHTGAIVATAPLGTNATYSSMVVDPTSHLVFVSDTTSNTIYVIGPTATPTVVQIAGYSGTLFVQPLISPFSSSLLVVAGSTVVNVFSITAIQSAQSSATPGVSGTYNKVALGLGGASDTSAVLKAPLLDAVNGVLYGAFNGIYAATIPVQSLYSVSLSSLPSGANSTTAVGTEVGVLDTFNPGLTSANAIPYALALVPNPSATTHPRIYAAQTGGVPLFAPTDANATGIQLFDTSLSTPITATTVPLTLTCPSGITGTTCKLLPSGIVLDPTNANVYVSGNLGYGTTSLTSVADYYVDVVQTPVNQLCSTPSTTTPVAGAPTNLTVYLCTSTGTAITSPAYTGTVHFTSTDSKAVLPANYTFQTSDAGSHTFSGVVLETSGSETISFADTVTSSTKGSTGYTVSAAGATTLTASAGTPQFAVAGTAYGTPLAATVTDLYGNGVPGVLVTFVAPTTGASGTFGGTNLVDTGSTGVAVAPVLTANSTAGAFSVTASSSGVSPVTFSLTNKPSLPLAELVPGIISTLHSDIGTTGSIPAAPVIDSTGNLYVLDSGLSSVTEYPAGGGAGVKIVPQAGQSATLNTPSDMVLEPSGTSLLVSDYANNRLVRVNLGSTVTTTALTLTGVPSSSLTCPNPISGTSLCLPTGVGVDGAGNIYVADSGYQRVLKLIAAGYYLSTEATTGGSFGTLSPQGVAVDPSGDVWIANPTGTSSGGILKVSAAGVESVVADGGNELPFGVAVDGAGDVYLTDSVQTTSAAQVIDGTPAVLAFAGDGVTTDSGDGGAATSAGIAGPLGITLDGKGNAYIADSVQSAANGGSIREVNGSASALVFPSTTDGLSSASKQVMLLNAGPAPLTIASVVPGGANPADFPLTNGCGTSLASGQSCALSFVFSPTIVGAESASVTITDNSGGTAGTTQTIALSGTGTALPVEGPPTFSPATGSTVAPGSTVVLSAPFGTMPTGYATIYYTTNGTIPTTSSTSCIASSCSVTLNMGAATETIEAFAALPGYTSSTVATATYTFATEGPPTFSPVTGSTVAPGSTVVLSAPFGTMPTGYATIYYTTNGTTPTTSSTSCIASSCSVTLASTGATETIEAFAALPGYTSSTVATAAYTFTLPVAPPPTFTPAGGGAVPTGYTVTIGDTIAGATIYYTTNGSAPTTSSTSCVSPCTLTLSSTVGTTESFVAIAAATGYQNSLTSTVTYITAAVAPSFGFAATGSNPAATVTQTGTVVGSQANPAGDSATVTLGLYSQFGYTMPVTISVTLGKGDSTVQSNPQLDLPFVSCVDVSGNVLPTTKSNSGYTYTCTTPYVPSTQDNVSGFGGTAAYVAFQGYDSATIPKPVPNPALSKPGSRNESKIASGGLAMSLMVLVLGTLTQRRRLLANAVKFLAMVCMIVSLGMLVAACNVENNTVENNPDDYNVAATITATPVGGGTPQSVTVWITYDVGP